MVAFTSFYTRRKNGAGIFAAGDFSLQQSTPTSCH